LSLHQHPPPRPPPSFPTRRSSDLFANPDRRALVAHLERPARRRRISGARADRVEAPQIVLAVALEIFGIAGSLIDEFETARCGSDRKSTRLNSSHVAISYAVFCLK